MAIIQGERASDQQFEVDQDILVCTPIYTFFCFEKPILLFFFFCLASYQFSYSGGQHAPLLTKIFLFIPVLPFFFLVLDI